MADIQEPGFPHYDYDGSKFDEEWASAPTEALAVDKGAGEKDAPTRMRISLLEYDQVIALSQTCLNTEIARHYTYVNKKLKIINVKLDSGGRESIQNGLIKPPWIELVETARAPQYLFLMEFIEGTFTYYDIIDEKANKVEKNMTGWILAFHVNLVETPLASLPDNLASKIFRPDAHVGTQLALTFGKDMQRLQFDRCRILGYDDDKRRNAAQHQLTTFVGAWIEQMKTSHTKDAEPVLVYTAKINPNYKDKVEASRANRPFPTPSSVNVQIISHRPDGVNDSGITTANKYNAFVYAQMTDGRTLPRDDLRWTGNWFYGAIGGTVLVKRAAFWDPLITKFTATARMAGDEVICNQISCAMGSTWKMSTNKAREDFPVTSQEAWTEGPDGIDSKWDGKRNVQSSETTPEQGHGAYRDDFFYDCSLSTSIRACTGEGRLKITIVAKTNATLTSTLFPYYSREIGTFGASLRLVGNFDTTAILYINLVSIDETGALKMRVAGDVESSQFNTTTKLSTAAASRDPEVKAYERTILDKQRFDSWKTGHNSYVSAMLRGHYAKRLQEGLDEYKKQIMFPNIITGGGQQIAMKDPIFNNKGDLMVGLSLVQGYKK